MDREKRELAGLAAFLKDEVEPRRADLLLFTCCLCSGLVDSTIYNGVTYASFWKESTVTDIPGSLQYIRVHADG